MRSPVRIARAGPSSSASSAGVSCTAAPSSSTGSKRTRGSSAREHGAARRRGPQTTPGSSSSSSRAAARLGGDDASVVRSPEPTSSASAARDDARRAPSARQLHGSSSGSCPRARTRWPSEGRVLGRIVGAEVAAAALLAGERALGDQPREQRGACAQPLEAGGVADQARVAPRARAGAPASRAARPTAPREAREAGAATGSPSAASAARRPKTRHSSSEFDASRFAPCTPVHAHSPAA